MDLVAQNAGAFGANDLFACKTCDGQMQLTRRMPHPELGHRFEEQRFTCAKCGRTAMRTVDENGVEPAPLSS